MRQPTPRNSTNVRFGNAASAAVLAAALWWAFVALLASSHALRTLEGDVPLLAGFACAVALLAYAVDAEVRGLMESAPAWICLTAGMAGIALCATHVAVLLAVSPIAAVCLAAALMRWCQPRISSAPAASPGARRAAP